MENNFEEKIYEVFRDNQEMPAAVRTALDNTYDEIKKSGKGVRVNMFWKKSLVAAACILALGMLAANNSVIAGIKGFLGFNDTGIEKIVDEGLLKPIDSEASDKNIVLSLDGYLYDAYKMAFIMTAEFEDADLLREIDEVNLDFRVKNGDGTYITEIIPDTKPLKAALPHAINFFSVAKYIDHAKSEIQFYVVLESIKGRIPKLEEAVVELETINLWKSGRKLKEINGQWDLAMNEDGCLGEEIVKYRAQKQSPDLEILSALSAPTSFNITFVLNAAIEGSGGLFQMKLVAENGEEFGDQGFMIEEDEGKTIVTTNFKASAFRGPGKYMLKVFSIGPPQKRLLDDQTAELVPY